MRLIANAGGEEEPVAWAGLAAISELQSPKSGDGDRRAVSVGDQTLEGPAGIVVSADVAVIAVDKIADQHVAAVSAEVVGGDRYSPRGSQIPSGGEPSNEGPVRSELVDIANSQRRLIGVRARRGVGHPNVAVEVLNVERRYPGGVGDVGVGQGWISERPSHQLGRREVLIVDVDISGDAVCRVKDRVPVGDACGEARIKLQVAAGATGDHLNAGGPLRGVPPRDRSIEVSRQELAGPARRQGEAGT